jgi:hypothetical protein
VTYVARLEMILTSIRILKTNKHFCSCWMTRNRKCIHCPDHDTSVLGTDENHQFFRRVRKNCEERLLASSCLSVFLSVCPRGTTWLPRDGFSRSLVLRVFRKSVEKIQVSLKSNENNEYLV